MALVKKNRKKWKPDPWDEPIKIKPNEALKIGRKDITKALTRAAVGYWVKKRYACLCELGVMPWGKRRADIVAVNHRGEVVILEVKSGLADLVSDHKMKEYIPYANRLYLVMRAKDWKKAEDKGISIPKGMGVLVLSNTGWCRVERRARFKLIDPEVQLRMFIRMAWASAPFSRRQGTRRIKVWLE
jgi:hypothetical protein